MLRAYDPAQPSLLEPPYIGDIKYTMQTAIEACIDAAQHVCASEGWGPPSTNADAMRVLAKHRAIDADLADAMARAVGFRNLLVHAYAEIDDKRVLETLGQINDLERFVDALSRLI